MIYMTEKAINKIKEISDADEIGHYIIRVRVLGGGCAGFSYDINFDNKINELDEVFENDGVSIVIDPLSNQYMEETTLDWLDNVVTAGFKFINPNVTGSCGCGNSVKF